MQERVLDKRPTWNFTTNEHISGNYYPINSAIAVIDPVTKVQFTVMNDRSQGGSVI
jgi:lysosomal alpha-mannosidase